MSPTRAKSSGSGNLRGRRGTYNSACDVCAKKKTKCDGNKPVCQPCLHSGREKDCAWSKNPTRKPRTEQQFEEMHKRVENLALEWRAYADYLESELDKSPHRSSEFRALRPQDTDGLLGISLDKLEHETDPTSDDDNPGDLAKELCIPMQSLKLEENGLYLYGNTAPFRFDPGESPLPSAQLSRFPALVQNPDGTYVLLTEGVPESVSHYNPDFDWSRHLPDIVPMDRRAHDHALDLLFKFFTSWCLHIVPALFLRDMYRSLSVPASHASPKTPHYSPMLHNALVALALAFVDDPKLRDLKSRQYFANKAKSYIEIECSKPTLSVVNALSTLACFYSSIGEDQTLGYLYFGMSAAMAQALGLNVNCSEWVKAKLMDEADLLDRRWTYWTTISQDVCWSLYVGRDFFMSSPSADTVTSKDISMPLVDHDYDRLPWVHPPSKLEPQPNYLTKTFQATCELLMIGRRIMDAVNRLDRSNGYPYAVDELVTAIDLSLNKWKEGLSSEVGITTQSQQTATPHKLMMHLAYWWLVILLHRPFFQRKGRFRHAADREIDSVERCRLAAENIMDLLSTWRRLYTLRYCPVALIQTVFSAGTVYILTRIPESTGVRIDQRELNHSIHQQNIVLQYLYEIGKSWKCATNIAGIMKNLMSEHSKRLLEHETDPILSSPSAASLTPDSAVDYNDDDSGSPSPLSKGRDRRRSSFIKLIHSRNHSVNNTSNPPPASHHSSVSLDNTVFHTQQDESTFTVSSSSHSIPIPISIPPNGNSYLATNSLSNLFPAFDDLWSLHRSNLLGSVSASPLVPSPGSSYVTSPPPSSASTSSQHNPNIGGYGQTLAHSPPVLDEPVFTSSGHTASDLFQGTSAPFGIHQELAADQLLHPSFAHQFTGQGPFAMLGVQRQATLSMAPHFPVVPLLPESTFTLDSLQTSLVTNGFPNYDPPATFGEGFYVNLDTDMDEDATWI